MTTQPADAQSKFITARQAAELFQVSLRTIRRMQYGNVIPSYRIGPKCVRFNRFEVERAITGTITENGGIN